MLTDWNIPKHLRIRGNSKITLSHMGWEMKLTIYPIQHGMGGGCETNARIHVINKALGIFILLEPWLDFSSSFFLPFLSGRFLTLLGFVKLTLILVYFLVLSWSLGCETNRDSYYWSSSSKEKMVVIRSQLRSIPKDQEHQEVSNSSIIFHK